LEKKRQEVESAKKLIQDEGLWEMLDGIALSLERIAEALEEIQRLIPKAH
jgi:hypothetical protein